MSEKSERGIEFALKASQFADNSLGADKLSLIHEFDDVFDELCEQFEKNGTLTNEIEEEIRERAFRKVPGSKEAERKWQEFFQSSIRQQNSPYN